MKLVVHELMADGLSQVVRASRRVNVEAIRPHLYRHNFASGSLQMQILNGVTVVATSAPVNISDIASLDYFHGYVRFDVNAYLEKDVDYTFKLISSGYTFDESAYIGWCVGFNELNHYDATYVEASNLDAPLDLEVWSRSDR